VAYVPQSDVLIPSLTVQECLRYSALLRLPQDTSPLDLQVSCSLGVAGVRLLGN
jgi:ABC-type multidrug transport system ATPase subunit